MDIRAEEKKSEALDGRPNALRYPPTIARRYGFAVAFVLAAFAIRYSMTPILGEELPFMLFIAASLLAAWYGGAASGIIALLLGLFLADYFFLWSNEPLPMPRSVMLLHVIRYVFTASLGIILIETLHRSRHRLQQAKEMLRTHAGELEKHVAERTASLATTVKSLEDLLSHIAHNLRAPLRAMRGYSDVLISEYSPKLDDNAKEYLIHISEAAGRMDTLIKALLDYGQLSHIDVNITDVSLSQTIERVLFQLAYSIKTSKAEVEVLGLFPTVRADGKILEQVLVNLLDNAIKFTALGLVPQIEIWAEDRESVMRLCLRDNGIGVPPQYHQRIFRPFECLHSEEAYDGTGIGLAIVKEGIERMGGRVGIESEPGSGSTFWVELPGEQESERGGANHDPDTVNTRPGMTAPLWRVGIRQRISFLQRH